MLCSRSLDCRIILIVDKVETYWAPSWWRCSALNRWWRVSIWYVINVRQILFKVLFIFEVRQCNGEMYLFLMHLFLSYDFFCYSCYFFSSLVGYLFDLIWNLFNLIGNLFYLVWDLCCLNIWSCSLLLIINYYCGDWCHGGLLGKDGSDKNGENGE